jgi:anti-sigma regulatory factor (Ser/Thr protein kinase)
MPARPRQLPLLERLSPGRWTAVVWGGAMAFACVDEFFVLPGDAVRDGQVVPGFDLTWVSGPILLGAAVLVLTACRILRTRPLVAYALLLLGSALGAGLLGQAAEFPLVQFLAPDVALYFVAATTTRRVSGLAAGMALTVLMIPLTVRLSGGGGINTAGQLAVATTAAGVRVVVRWDGRRRPLPPDIDLSAYRIVQEAVTNVVRHAGARSCLVRVDHRDAELTPEITDTGRGPGGDGSRAGYGLVGMRERVALLQGEFTAGARPEGGFRVTARLPLPHPAPYEKPTPLAS